jgi:hypothetical protein
MRVTVEGNVDAMAAKDRSRTVLPLSALSASIAIALAASVIGCGGSGSTSASDDEPDSLSGGGEAGADTPGNPQDSSVEAADDRSDSSTSPGADSAAPGDSSVDGGSQGSTPCTAVTGPNPVYSVDPIRGSDTTGTGNVAVSPACAFQTITRALQFLGGAAPAGTTIQISGGTVDAGASLVIQGTVVSPPVGEELFPLHLGANITVTASGGPVTILVPSGSIGFILSGASSGIASGTTGTITIDGQNHAATTGIEVTSPSATVTGVTVQGFGGDGVLVNATSAQLTLGAGSQLVGNGRAGAYVSTGSLLAVSTPGDASAQPIAFSDNAVQGVHVCSKAAAFFTGQLGGSPPSTSTIVMEGNGNDGIWVESDETVVQSLFTGVASTGAAHGSGLRIIPGSNVKVRGSWFLGNSLDGIDVENTAAKTSADLTKIDLGSAASGAEVGGNVVQASGVSANVKAGICLRLPAGTAGVTLLAQGNVFRDVSCANGGGTLVANGAHGCSGGVDVGGDISASGSDAGAANKIDVTACTYP